MEIKKKEMKKALAVIKRVTNNTKTGLMYCESKGDMRLYLKAMSPDGSCIAYQVITNAADDVFACSFDPHLLDKYITEVENQEKNAVKEMKEQAKANGLEPKVIKEEEKAIRTSYETITLMIDGHKMCVPNTNISFPMTPIQEDLYFHFTDTTDMQSPEKFIQLLKEAETILKKNKEGASCYLRIVEGKALAIETKHIHFFRIDESLPFEVGYLHKDQVSVLAKSLKSDCELGMKGDWLIIRNQDVDYVLRVETNISFPPLRSMQTLKKEAVFTVDCDQMNELLANYKKTKEKSSAVADLVITMKDDQLTFDPRHEEYPTMTMDITPIEGTIRRAIFDNEVLRAFFGAYEGVKQVEQQLFKNAYGVVGYRWTIYTPEKMTMIAGIEEPDWEKIEEHFRTGTMKQLTQGATKNED